MPPGERKAVRLLICARRAARACLAGTHSATIPPRALHTWLELGSEATTTLWREASQCTNNRACHSIWRNTDDD
jgi:hypothetical protein